MRKLRFFGIELLFGLLLYAGVAGTAGAQTTKAKPLRAETSPSAPAERKSNVAPPDKGIQQMPNANLQETTSTGWISRCTSEFASERRGVRYRAERGVGQYWTGRDHGHCAATFQ